MDKRVEHLLVLGLGPDASWSEVTQAYKDLMRVWHPDRFPNDERLRKRAHEQSQRINYAMSELRKLGKDPSRLNDTTSEQSSSAHKTTDTATHDSTYRSTPHSSHADYGPLYVSLLPFVSLKRMLGSAALALCSCISLLQNQRDHSQAAFAVSAAFFFFDVSIRHFVLLVFPRPLVIVDRSGLFLPRTGKLRWRDIGEVWPVISPRSSSLQVMFSPAYVKSRYFLSRVLLWLRSMYGLSHLAVSFNGLNKDPVQVVNDMKLRQLHNQIDAEEREHVGSTLARVAHLVSLICVAVVLVRMFALDLLTPLDWLPYLVIFGLSRSVCCFKQLSHQ